MEDAGKPQKGSDPVKEKEPESATPDEPTVEEQQQDEEPDAKKSFKRFLLINAGVAGAVLLILVVLFLFMVPRSPEESLSEENARLKAEIKRLKEVTTNRLGKKSKEQRRIEGLIEQLQPRLGPSVVEPIAGSVVTYAQTYDLPPELILSIMNTTSRFEVTAEGQHGSVGLMHISPKIYRDGLNKLKITEQEAFHIDNNVHLGCMILRDLRDQGRSMEVAIATLIGSEGMVDEILVGFTIPFVELRTTLLFLLVIGMSYRIYLMERSGEKEELKRKVRELEDKVRELEMGKE